MKQNGSSSTAKSGRSLIVIGVIIYLIMGVLLLLASFMVRKEANSISRYALYIYKILTIKVVADGSTEVAYKGLISMANDISNRDLYPSIMLFVGPILYYLSLKAILTLARDLPVMAYAMKQLSKSPKLVKVISYVLLLIAFPLTFVMF